MTSTSPGSKSAADILVVDDDPFMLKLLQRILSVQGYHRITTCLSGASALDILDNAPHHPALIFLDLNMPEMDGIEFVRHLVQRQFAGHLILISGEDLRMLSAAQRLVEAHRIAIVGHLQKPLTPESIATMLASWEPSLEQVPLVKKQYTAAELQQAIELGQLVNYYQPKVVLSTGRVAGLEVLVRWHHPTDGVVMPDAFIVLAEDNQLIDALAHKVLDQALKQHIQWAQQGINLPLAINISMENLASLEFADSFSAQIMAAGLLPKDITLEITESRAMKDPAVTLDTLTRLRLKRFILAIDDFGTGHSSLAQLRDIPFDEFKIDKSFVNGAWADKRIKVMFDTSLNLAQQLHMQVVAEGVENQRDWDFVRQTPCDYAQGYFIAKPLRAETLPSWLAEWNERVRRDLFPEVTTSVSKMPDKAKGTVLIVEDHEFQRRIQSKILREEGYTIVSAANAVEAMKVLRNLRPLLILLDIDLPDLDGLQLTRRLRSTAIFKHTPVVIVSGVNDKATIEKSLSAGATMFLAKPFDRKALIDKVHAALAVVNKN
ncbi:EAL domain-containing protein [Cellvibrio sp. ARAG 10.3]|uniref:EAL domain-containing protein n=1 Tax=Cellvibrio sp. ARAG 10.3 TaxID=3451358 RepID=UPI003F47D79C